jgi:hypothetical protein
MLRPANHTNHKIRIFTQLLVADFFINSHIGIEGNKSLCTRNSSFKLKSELYYEPQYTNFIIIV